MTIRARMTLLYSAALLVSILLILILSLDELRERKEPKAQPNEGWEELVGIVVWVGIPTVLLSIGGGWWLMHKALTPVTALTEAARRVTERNLNQELPRTRNGDELDQLTEVLNAMTARLHQSFTRIREFTLHASHELKTPLTVLCGETESELHDETLSSAERERSASRLDELRRLARIVDGLTLLAKADSGLIPLALAPVCLDELVGDSFADTQVLAQASGLTVEMTACEETVVRGDAHRLRQLLLNLVDNAVKYNQTGGSVAMALRRKNGTAHLTIVNTGPGIAAEALPHVFERFYRGDPAHSSVVEGCGLGLSIAQWIVTAHNGTIQIESTPSRLTTVTVLLPLWPEKEPDDRRGLKNLAASKNGPRPER
jgi:signal transduction histidine kinase